MRLPEEYLLAREHVRDVDFGIISGLDWGRGPNRIGRKEASIHAFETVIRYVGGLLGAYDLSGDPLLLKRAEELAKIILPVFDTSSGVPLSRLNAKTPLPVYGGHSIQLAEAGTLALEYTRLAQITGNRTYFDLAQRGMDYLDQVLAPKSTFQPLLPSVFSTEAYRGGMMGTFSFGGQGESFLAPASTPGWLISFVLLFNPTTADSYYEYLIKQHVLLRGAVPRYAQLVSPPFRCRPCLCFSLTPFARPCSTHAPSTRQRTSSSSSHPWLARSSWCVSHAFLP
jgi:mannosyl-oligosaccharide alpha-1,2-mannosidase